MVMRRKFPNLHPCAVASFPMDALLNDPDALHAHISQNVRIIRNIQLGNTDFLPLIEERKKIPGTTIDAFGAVLQQIEERSSGTADFCAFSSWLGPLVSGKEKEGGLHGTVEGHIKAAVCGIKN